MISLEQQIDTLDLTAQRYASYQEGSICYLGGAYPQVLHPDHHTKIDHWQQLNRQVRHTIEVGFNAGHSTVLAMSVNADLRYTSIDVCLHRYTQPCARVVTEFYGARFQFLAGGSSLHLPQLTHSGHSTLFAIDGGHSRRQLESDLYYVTGLAHAADYIWIDDTDRPELASVVSEYFSTVEFYPSWAVVEL